MPTSSCASRRSRDASPAPGRRAQHIARKRFGQHFHSDPAIFDAIVRAIDPRPGVLCPLNVCNCRIDLSIDQSDAFFLHGLGYSRLRDPTTACVICLRYQFDAPVHFEPLSSPVRSLLFPPATSVCAGAELPSWICWPGVPIGGGRTMAHPVPAAAVPVVLWLARAGQGCTGCALPFPFLTWCGCATRVVLRRESDSPPPPTGGPACPGCTPVYRLGAMAHTPQPQAHRSRAKIAAGMR